MLCTQVHLQKVGSSTFAPFTVSAAVHLLCVQVYLTMGAAVGLVTGMRDQLPGHSKVQHH